MPKCWCALLVVACWLGGSGAAHAAFTANPTTVEFATTAVGASSTGTSQLTNDTAVNATLRLANGCEFTTTTPTLPLGPTANTASFKFTPTTGGDKTCTVTVKDDSGVTLGTLTLHGVASGTPKILLSTATLAFNDVGVTETSATMHVTATNNGTDVLHISGATVVTGPSNYTVTGTTGVQTVAVGAQAAWDIACKPTKQGSVNDTFRIASDASGAANADIALICNGLQGVLAVDTTSLDYGSVVLNGAVTKNVVLSNTGNTTVTVTGTLDNTNVGYSVVAGTIPATLGAGKTATVMVKFAPTNATDGATSHVKFNGNWTAASTHAVPEQSVTLTGKVIALSLSSTTIDFGDFRYDSQPKQQFILKNDGSSDVTISTIALAPDAGTTLAELPFTITLDGTAVTPPATLAANHQFVIEITAKPNNRVGAIGGKITATSAGATLSPVTVKGTSTAAVIQTTDAVFGAVDLQAAHPKLSAIIKNTTMDGAVLDVSAITIMTTQGTAGAFTFTNALPSGVTHLTQGGTINLEATYTPTVTRAAGDADKVVLVATLTGSLNGPTTMMLTLSGRGIDRHLVLPAQSPVFPATFRNPGTTAPTMPVTIQNAGEATLSVSAIMALGEPVWSLVDATPVDIPGGGSHDFVVKFAPTDIGPAPQGRILFSTNDTTAVTAAIQLDGTAVPRDVQFGPLTNVEPRTINLGVGGVEAELTLDDALVVASSDPANRFRIRDIVVADASVFHIEGDPAGQVLDPAATKSFGVTLIPPTAGDFVTTATLYLDQDPVPHAQVQLVGTGVAIGVGGGGGCDAGGDSRGGAGAIIVLGVVVALRRRRGMAIAAPIVVVIALGAGRADADEVRVGAFDATPATTGTGIVVQGADVGRDGAWVMTSVMSYATDLVVAHLMYPSLDSEQRPVSGAALLELGSAYAFLDRYEVGASVPLYVMRNDVLFDLNVALPRAHNAGLGDVALYGKVHLADAGPLAIGAALRVTVPTATMDFVGAEGPTARALALATWTPSERWTLSGNAGAIVRQTADYRHTLFIEQGSGFAWGASVARQVSDRVAMTGEVFGEVVPAARGMMGSVSPVEGLVGLRYRGDHVAVGFAAGAGLNSALGAPGARVTVTLTFLPKPRDRVVAVAAAPRVVRDRDGDGIADDVDRCPDAAEDKDGFEDDDGCPDPDNDGDGIADAQDRCPDVAESFNGIDDDDGCPEPVATVEIDPHKPVRDEADRTFARGRDRLAQKDYLGACAAFEQSFQLDPAAGTRFNLATCYAELGKLATASALFAELAASDKNAERRALAAQRGGELVSRVPRLKLVVVGAPPGLQVTLDGRDATAWVGAETPVDFGVYRVAATAVGRPAWHGTAVVRHEAETVTLEIRIAE